MGWRGSSDRAGRTNATLFPSDGSASRGAQRGQGLGDHLAGGSQGTPNNHNGGSTADPAALRPGGMLGPRNVCDQSRPGPAVQPGGLRPPLFAGGVGEPLFLLLLRELSGKLAWLSVALKSSVRLLMQRIHLFLLRAFVTAEDFRLPETVEVFLRVLGELQPEGWASLMHVSTSPKPVLQAPDPEVAARGLGEIGTYHISDALWDEVVGEGVDVERLASGFAPEVAPSPAVLHRRETDPLVEPMLRSLELGGVVERVVQGQSQPATCWPFIIPKSSEKVSVIFHLVDFNDTMPRPARFSLCSWENMADRLSAWPPREPLFCTHIDLKNAFWSFVLPPKASGAFRFGFRPGGGARVMYRMRRMPFGWKFSPLLCQLALQKVIAGIVPPHMIIFHYLDDFLLLGGCPAELREVTKRVVEALKAAGFLVSPKSVLEPTTHVLFLGKHVDTQARRIWSHPRAYLQMFAQWLRLATAAHPHPRHLNKVLGFIQWHVRPRRGIGPFLAGAYCWQRWGAVGQPVPLKVLHGLATAIVFAMEPWHPPSSVRWSLQCALHRPVALGRHAFATMFVDAALDVFRYRAGMFLPGRHEVRSVVIPPCRHTQQSAELWGLCWAVREAKRRGWRFLVLVTDSQVAGAQMVSLRARTWLHRQNKLLRSTVIRLTQCGLVVGVHWVSSELQPADPPSRLDAVACSSTLRALRLAQLRWAVVRAHAPGPESIGVVWL